MPVMIFLTAITGQTILVNASAISMIRGQPHSSTIMFTDGGYVTVKETLEVLESKINAMKAVR